MKQICLRLGLRYSEEVSLLKASCLDAQRLVCTATNLESQQGTAINRNGSGGSSDTSSILNSASFRHSQQSDVDMISYCDGLTNSPHLCSVQQQLIKHCVKYKSVSDKTRVNARFVNFY